MLKSLAWRVSGGTGGRGGRQLHRRARNGTEDERCQGGQECSREGSTNCGEKLKRGIIRAGEHYRYVVLRTTPCSVAGSTTAAAVLVEAESRSSYVVRVEAVLQCAPGS